MSTNIFSSETIADAAIAKDVVEQASRWLMRLWDGGLNANEHVEFETWLAADCEHRRAWQRLQQLQGVLERAPAQTVQQVLGDVPNRARRKAIRQLGASVLIGVGGQLVYTRLPWREITADYRTASGEIRKLTLGDGTQLAINSGSVVDIRYSARERRIRLLRGELLIQSGHDGANRPLLVETAAGQIRALGTRFDVREIDGGTRVDLFEGRLAIDISHTGARTLEAGNALWFSRDVVGAERAADNNLIAWEKGKLVAERQRLGDFLDDLQRHRPGVIRCEAAVADLPITGVFPLADTDLILAAVQNSLPVQVRYRTRYWVSVSDR